MCITKHLAQPRVNPTPCRDRRASLCLQGGNRADLSGGLCWRLFWAGTALDFTRFPALSLVLRGQTCSQWHKGGSCLAGREGRGLEWLPAAVVAISELTVTPPVHTKSRQCSAVASRSTWADHCLNLFIYIQNSQVPFQVQVRPYRDKTHPCAWRGLGWTGRCWQGKAWKSGHEPRC